MSDRTTSQPTSFSDLARLLRYARAHHGQIALAIEVIAEQGFQRTKIKQIAARAGVADGTIYNYFKNKDAIFLAIMARLTEAEVRELDFAEAQQIKFADFASSRGGD